ncbi:MAG: hypothetical protein QMC04_00750 [Ilumatobacter sp.]|jgi:hypothetical protein|uniref:hypothetical protein n=1 Tax=uncultured Ilumatobacter sp. TaxID=879968 RepID=UPI00359192E7|tara:strand:+ start:888 stop:2567 length:1680 start_codon:yes stop_codon:yes gene_type:complete
MEIDMAGALRDLRRTRQSRRLGDAEWFDVAYRVYLFALVGLTGVVLASDAIDGVVGDGIKTSDLLARGPSVVGLIVVLAFGLGLRSGADGGPVAIEVADIRHVLLSPINRRRALLRPVGQRIRSVTFSFAMATAVLGQFVAREVEGSRAAWAAAGALFGAVTGAVFVTSAVIAHVIRLPRWAATAIAAVGLAWQGAAAWINWNGPSNSPLRFGPANLDGSLAFWGIRQQGIDVVAIAVTLAAIALSLALCGGLRIEPLARRGSLVTQLRFAATVQDLRTVVMLRRQLRAETLRSTPWGGSSRTPISERSGSHGSIRSMIWRRGFRSLRRLPASRLARIASLAIVGGVCASLAASSSLLFLLGTLAALFLLGMEAIEPLSQEIDRPDITDGLPIERGRLFAYHLVAPAALLVVAAVLGAAAASVLEPSHAAAAFAIALPATLAGAIGPVAGAVLDAPTPIAVADTNIMGTPRDTEQSFVPPEFAGFSNAFSTFLPIVLTSLGLVPIVAMRFDPSAGTALRATIGVALVFGLLVRWVQRRDRWGVAIRSFFEAGRAERQAT